MGRLPVITTLHALDKEQLVRILTEPKNALVKQYQKLLEYDMVDLEFEPEALEAAADKAIERGIGARGLRAVLEEVMTQVMYDVPSDPTIAKVTITAESVTEHAPPEIEHDPSRTQRPRLGGASLRAEQGGPRPRGTYPETPDPERRAGCGAAAGSPRFRLAFLPLREVNAMRKYHCDHAGSGPAGADGFPQYAAPL